MDDSVTVEDNLDAFSAELFGNTPAGAENEEVSENTPSATENESEESEANAEDVDGDDAAAEDEHDEEKVEETKPRRRRNAQDRIDELTQDKYELKRRIAELERLTTKGQEKSEETPAQVKPAAKTDAPTPDAVKEDGTPLYPLGEFDPQYIADLTRHTIRQENEAFKKASELENQQKQMEAAQQELTKNWATKVEAAAERLPDLPQKFGVLQEAFQDIPPEQGNFLASSIMSLENGPDVLSYFADNLDEARLLMKGGIFETVIALGRLDGEFSAKNKGVEKGTVANRATNAPPPPPVHTKGSTNVKTLDVENNLDDFEKVFFSKK